MRRVEGEESGCSLLTLVLTLGCEDRGHTLHAGHDRGVNQHTYLGMFVHSCLTILDVVVVIV
jgi:hypothetical protein